jgi:membrane protein YqaA with SNARE-associated domain
MLHRLVGFVQPLAAGLGAPGLFLVAFLDSSFLTFPEVPDVLLIWLVVRHPWGWLYYASMATAGSVLGCYAIYLAARKGGEAVLRRFHARTTERALAAIRKYGMLAVIVPAILPPPLPFKIFVVLAGVSSVPTGSFIAAVVVGRGFRYVVEALLAYRFGDAAMLYISQNVGRLSIWMAISVAVLGVAFILWRRRRGAVDFHR